MPDNPFPLLAAPRWRLLNRCHGNVVPVAWRPWLQDKGSLTRRLVTASNGDFRVQVLRQSMGLPLDSEASALGIAPRHWALIREVVLIGCDKPWVYARSIVPAATLSGRLRRLRQLDSRPLGEVLFSDNSMRRDPVEVAQLSSTVLPGGIYPHRPPAATLLWGRRSVFHLDDKPLLVAEFFLPDFDPYNSGR